VPDNFAPEYALSLDRIIYLRHPNRVSSAKINNIVQSEFFRRETHAVFSICSNAAGIPAARSNHSHLNP
jgi:hypothetical protein